MNVCSRWNCFHLQVSSENVLEKRIAEMSEELRKSESKNASLAKDLQSKEQAVDTAQKECAYLKDKLEELGRSLVESDQSTRQIQEKLKVRNGLYNFTSLFLSLPDPCGGF